MRSIWWGYAILAVTGLSCTGSVIYGDRQDVTACVEGPGCKVDCDRDVDCAAGYYCNGAGLCDRDCDIEGDGATDCEGELVCSPNGRCVSANQAAATQAHSEREPEDRDQAAVGAAPDEEECVRTQVQAKKVIPTVMLIVDQSSSMDEDFGGRTRWDVLRDSLLEEPKGLIAALQSQVRFGLALYSAENEENCPTISQVDPDLDNLSAIAETYEQAEPIQDTPTGDAIDAVLDSLEIRIPGPDDPTPSPVVFVLATDGEPDRCEELNPQNGQQEALSAVERAYGMGVRTFIISVGDELSDEHHRAMANAGLGRTGMDPQADYWVAGDDETLRAALTEIISGKLSCEITLNGQVGSTDACAGSVKLNGTELTCNDKNGWELSDSKHIRLRGRACDELNALGGASIDVSFPCEVQVLF